MTPGLIAVVGCDGTGKTRIAHDLVTRLRARGLRAERRYLGLVSGETGDRIKALPLVGVALERYLAAKSRRAQDMERKLPGTPTALVMFALSRWRMRQLRKVVALARAGVLVIAERYPQAEIAGFHFDGPGLAPERTSGRLARALARREQRLYERMAEVRPRLIIRLTIDAETAYSRKPDHPIEELRAKIAIMPRIGYDGAQVREIDARMRYEQVLDATLAAIDAVLVPPA